MDIRIMLLECVCGNSDFISLMSKDHAKAIVQLCVANKNPFTIALDMDTTERVT